LVGISFWHNGVEHCFLADRSWSRTHHQSGNSPTGERSNWNIAMEICTRRISYWQRSRGRCRYCFGSYGCPISYRIPSLPPLGRGNVRLVAFRLPPLDDWSLLVRYTNILRCKPNIYLPAVYVWTQMEGSAQHSAIVGRYLNKAADLFLHRLASPGTIRESQS
jgi:hypothetical protein